MQDLELAFLVTTLTLSIALGLVSKRSNQDGLIFCGLCVLFAAIATMLYSYRDLALEPFRHAVPNVFFSGSYALLHAGISIFQKRKLPKRELYGFPLLITLTYIAPYWHPFSYIVVAYSLYTLQVFRIIQAVTSKTYPIEGYGKALIVFGLF